MKKGMKGKGVSQRRLVLKSKETPATVYLIQSGRRHAEAASTHNVNCKLLSGKEEDLESSGVFVSAVLSNDETAFCRINAARREVRSGGELHKGPPQQHRHRPRQ